MLDI
jgi:kumamolisin